MASTVTKIGTDEEGRGMASIATNTVAFNVFNTAPSVMISTLASTVTIVKAINVYKIKASMLIS